MEAFLVSTLSVAVGELGDKTQLLALILAARFRRPLAVILQSYPLVGGAAPQKDRAHDVQRVLLQHQSTVAVHVGIGEIDGQGRIVIAQVGAE